MVGLTNKKWALFFNGFFLGLRTPYRALPNKKWCELESATSCLLSTLTKRIQSRLTDQICQRRPSETNYELGFLMVEWVEKPFQL